MRRIVSPAKYRGAVITSEADEKLNEACKGIKVRYEIKFLEMGTGKDHARFLARFLAQSAPAYSPARITQIIKGITAKKYLKRVRK
jgi:putative transposase